MCHFCHLGHPIQRPFLSALEASRPLEFLPLIEPCSELALWTVLLGLGWQTGLLLILLLVSCDIEEIFKFLSVPFKDLWHPTTFEALIPIVIHRFPIFHLALYCCSVIFSI